MKKLILTLAAALMLTVLTACDEKINFDQGLQYVTVDGITVDITMGDEMLEAALGERFAVIKNRSDLPKDEKKVILTHIQSVDYGRYKEEQFLVGNVSSGKPDASVAVCRDMPPDMSLSEYKSAYAGLYFEDMYGWGNIDGHSIKVLAQIDGVLADPEQLTADMYASDFGDSDTCYSYLLELWLGGKAEELVLMTNMFDGEDCYVCILQYFTAK